MEKGPNYLNKYIAHCGICSRRKAVDLIKNNLITVNNIIINTPHYIVKENDEVKYQNKKLKVVKNLVYILLNKPKDYICTHQDTHQRKTIFSLLKKESLERVYTIGRLDRNSTGVILITNDGELTQKLSHPSFEVKKIYEVGIDKKIKPEDIKKLIEGFELEDGFCKMDAVAIVKSGSPCFLGIEIHSGKNRIIRRMLAHLGYEVIRLDRVMYADLTKLKLPRGHWRYLTTQEIVKLKKIK